MANGPLSRGLLGAVDIATKSRQLQQTQQQINQRQAQTEMDNAFKAINLGIDLEDDALTQSGLDVVNQNFGTTISTDAIGENRKAFQKQINILVEEGKNLQRNPQAVPAFRQAVNNFNLKYSVGKFAEQAEAVTGAAEPIITGAEEAEAVRQREIFRGIPQEGELTPEQEITRAGIAGGVPPAQITAATKPPAATQISNELSLAMFGKPFGELEQPQKQAVLAARQERAVEVGAAREKAKIEVRKEAPLSSTDLQRFVNPETLEKFPAGTTLADVEAVGGFAATPKQLEDITGLDQVVTIVDVLDQLSANLNTVEVGPLALAHGARLSAGAIAGTNPIARAYRDQKEQFLSLLARTFGERGVLTDRDIGRISDGLPSFGDTKDVRDFKIGAVKLLFDVATEARKRVITGKKPTIEQKKRITELVANLASEGAVIEEEIPKGLPEGAFKIGTSGGKNVYQTPDGKKFIED